MIEKNLVYQRVIFRLFCQRSNGIFVFCKCETCIGLECSSQKISVNNVFFIEAVSTPHKRTVESVIDGKYLTFLIPINGDSIFIDLFTLSENPHAPFPMCFFYRALTLQRKKLHSPAITGPDSILRVVCRIMFFT